MPRVPLIVSWNGITPRIASDAFVAQNATLVGDVTMARESSAYFGSVLRGDRESITVGPGTNIQDNVTVHAEINAPVVLGANVSVGHNAVVHGCVVEDGCLLGMGSAVLNGARIGTGSLVAAGTVVLEGIVVPPGCLVAGVPGKVRRELSAEEQLELRKNAEIYRALSADYLAASID